MAFGERFIQQFGEGETVFAAGSRNNFDPILRSLRGLK